MPFYSPSKIYEIQQVANSAAALTFFPPVAGGLTIVPANYAFQIATAYVSNIDNVAVSLKAWRVPSGASDDDAHVIVPTINIPVASNTNPYFALTALWNITLAAGDAIWAVAGVASKLNIFADGYVISI